MPTFCGYVTDFVYETESIWPTNTRGIKGCRLDFIGVHNAHTCRTLPPMRPHQPVRDGGRIDPIAGSKRVNAGGIPDQTFSAGERENGFMS